MSDATSRYRTTQPYLPPWPSLDLRLLLRDDGAFEAPFPLREAPHAVFAVRARNLIYHLFRALTPQGGHVLVPDYHHGAEIGAIRAAGATPVPFRIGSDLRPDLDQLATLCAARPRALFVIHYFGWPQPIEAIAEICRTHEVVLVEDCALSLLSAPGGRALGTHGAFAVYCLYKTLGVPDGAVLVQNTERLPGLEHACTRPSGMLTLGGRVLDLTLERVRLRAPHAARVVAAGKRQVGRALTAAGFSRLPIGDSVFDPGTADLAISPLTRTLLGKFDYETIRRLRRRNFLLLQARLGNDHEPTSLLADGICPLFFPVLAERKQAAAELLRQRGIGVTELWNDEVEGFGPTTPTVRFLRQSVLELPIHQDVGEREIDYLAQQVRALGLRPLGMSHSPGATVPSTRPDAGRPTPP